MIILGAPSQEFLEQPITSSDHRKIIYLALNSYSIPHLR
jgi:hypothetical protein